VTVCNGTPGSLAMNPAGLSATPAQAALSETAAGAIPPAGRDTDSEANALQSASRGVAAPPIRGEGAPPNFVTEWR